MSTPITEQDLEGVRFRATIMMRLGKGGFMHMGKCEQHPRLTMEKGRTTFREPIKRRYFVDGVECATRAEIVVRLNQPAPEQKDAPML